MPGFVPPWDLRQRGQKDSVRHDVRVKDAIKKNLKEIISEETIISSDGTRRIRVPLRYLEQYHFKYGNPQQQGAGQGEGTVGDILWAPGQSTPGDRDPGDLPGAHGYETEVDLETIIRMMLEDLALPWLEEKPAARELPAETYQFNDLRPKGPWSHLDKRTTLKNNLTRNAIQGTRGVHDLSEHDLRFRVWDVHRERTTNAAVYLLMDISGSMTTDKRYVAKCLGFWLVCFLRLKYRHVEIVFIAHDTEAELVNEQDFFGKDAGGGTRCSSAYTVALREMTHHHPAARWNVYLWHFSDGDNAPADNVVCRARMDDLLRECTMCAYAEIKWSTVSGTPSSLLTALKQIQHPRFVTTVLRGKENVQEALRAFLGAEVEALAP